MTSPISYPLEAVEFELKDNPWRFRGETDIPLSDHKLKSLEERFGIELPAAYRYHLMRFGAGEFGSGEVFSPDPMSEWNWWKHFEQLEPLSQIQVIPFSDSNTDCNVRMDYYVFVKKGNEISDEVRFLNLATPTEEIGRLEVEHFRDFIIKECIYPIPPP